MKPNQTRFCTAFVTFIRRIKPRQILFLLSVLALNDIAAAQNSNSENPNGSDKPIIRDIKIIVRDIFDEPDLPWFYRAANSLKINTREEVVRRELLFQSGDRFDQFVLDESTRNLRSLPFLRQIVITPVRDGDFVDVTVSVQDTWTILLPISFSIGTGRDKSSIGVSEGNLGGFGKRFETLYADDEGREKIEGIWDDTRFMNTYERLTLGRFNRSDGYRNVAYYGRPFRSLIDPYAWAGSLEDFDLVGRLFQDGDESFIYRRRHLDIDGGYTFSRGDPKIELMRHTFGWSFSKDHFEEASDDDFSDVDVDPEEVSRDPALLAEDRVFNGPFYAFRNLEQDFVSANYIDKFERVEDFNLGNDFNARIGYAPSDLHAKQDTLILNLNDSDGIAFSDSSFARGEILGNGQVDTDGLQNFIFRAGAKYFNVFGPQYLGDFYIGKHTLAGSIYMDYGQNLYRDVQLSLGSTNGLRGYDDRAFNGDKRLLVNLEERIHIADDIYRLISLGAAVFFDGGGTTEGSFGRLFDDDFYSDVGIGLRFGFPRSVGGSVVRMDLAFSLRSADDGTEEYEPRLLISTGHGFNSKLSSTTLEPRPQDLEIGVGN